jgi:hypothetical protein
MTEEDLRRIIIPQVEFRNALLLDAVQWLRQQSCLPAQEGCIPGLLVPEPSCGVSILLLVPESSAAQARISLHLENVPLWNACYHVAQAAGLEMRHNASGIYLCPPAVGAAIEACAPLSPEQDTGATETASWLRAAKRWPECVVGGSRLHALLQRKINAIWEIDPAYFQEPNWPEKLCERFAPLAAMSAGELPVVYLPDAEPPTGFSLN